MSNDSTQASTPGATPGAEGRADTGDVREAIQRAQQVGTPEEQTALAKPVAPEAQTSEADHRAATGAVPTEPYVISDEDAMPSAAAEPSAAVAEPQAPAVTPPPATPAAPAPAQQPGQISIDADHPMAALYIQQPMPPTMQGNRLGGIFISLLATLVFALVYAGILALWQAPQFPPSTFLNEGLLPLLTSLGFVLPIGAFFVALVILVLIANRGGWWVYVIFGLLVAGAVWVAAAVGYALSPQLTGDSFDLSFSSLLNVATTIPALAAAVAAREVTVWFGAWIGARGRRVKARNAVAVKEYEAKLAEVQAKLS